ncbi:hypothetical protein [Bacillus sp. ISL-41]|nr:hypothetical protein [Bacillus sp. ISL-41]
MDGQKEKVSVIMAMKDGLALYGKLLFYPMVRKVSDHAFRGTSN